MRRSGLLRAAGVATAAVVLAGCTASSTSEAPLGAAGCDPASPITTGPEIRGTGQHATLYGLIMTTSPLPIRTGEQVKIVWRMTGSGPLHLSATTGHSTANALQWGPEVHGGSNYSRPGSEWGAGYLFPSPGCWQLHAQRTVGSADVWIRVRPT